MNIQNTIEILQLIKSTFESTLKDGNYTSTISRIKHLFLERRYHEIFFPDSNNTNLPFYAAEYTPMRALCYASLPEQFPVLKTVLSKESCHVLCLGGGSGGELIGFSAAMRGLPSKQRNLEVDIVDVADYTDIVSKISTAINDNWNVNVTVNFRQADVLNWQSELYGKADLVTCMFLLNEVFAMNKKQAVGFVTRLVKSLKHGGMLLVVDSAGSFSDIQVGGNTYSVHQLLDIIQDLEVVEETDSKWYRVPDGFQQNTVYPVKVNNLRYFLRLYRKK